MNDREDIWDLEGRVTAKEVATSKIRRKLQDVQRVSKDGGEAMPRRIAEDIELVCEGVETKRKHAKLSKWNTDCRPNL